MLQMFLHKTQRPYKAIVPSTNAALAHINAIKMKSNLLYDITILV